MEGRGHAKRFSVTMDDPNTYPTPRLSPEQRDQAIRSFLTNHKLQAALFVCGERVESPQGRELLSAWSRDGHIIGNHSYSHLHLHDPGTSIEAYTADLLRGEHVISGLPSFQSIFRFPFLKEGNTIGKREELRAFLKARGYRNGAVTINASDWYIDQRLSARLRANPSADISPYREFYLKHILRRATYYDDLARRVIGRSVRHTLLLHHNLLNASFLGDLLEHLQRHGWQAIDAQEAFSDPIFLQQPNVLPAGESLIWSLAKATGQFDSELRYPGEDGRYEKDEMDRLGL